MTQELNEDFWASVPYAVEPPSYEKERKNLIYEGGKDVIAGVGMGIAEAGAEFVDFTTDLGVMGSIMFGRAVSAATGAEHDYESDERILAKKQKFFDQYITGQLKTDDVEGEGLYNFTKNTTESIAKFATAYKSLGKMGMTAILPKVTVTGALEGVTDDPNSSEDSFKAAESLLRVGLGSISEDALSDFDQAMNPDTDNQIARQSMRRVMNAIDMSAFSVAGQKAADVGGAAIKAIPEKHIQAVKQQFHNAMKTARVVKEQAFGKAATTKAAKFEIQQGVAEEVIGVADDAILDPTKTLSQNIGNFINVKFDSTMRLVSPEHYDAKLLDYEKKLASLAPQINDKIVSMAKTQGVEAKALLRDYAKELGVKESEFLTEKGLQGVLRTQAHNILLEQEALKFSLTAKGYFKGALPEDDFLKATESFLIAHGQRAAGGGAAGRILRTMQNSPLAVNVSKATKPIQQQLDKVAEVLKIAKDDKAQVKAFGESLAENLKIKEMLDLSEDEFTETFIRAVLNEQDIAKAGEKMGIMMQMADTLGRTTQANLLTGTPTMVQNTLGTVAMQVNRIGEAYIKAGLSGDGVKNLHVANTLLTGTVQGYVISAKAALKAMKTAGERNAGNLPFTTRFKQLAADIPAFDKAHASRMFDVTKKEIVSDRKTGNAMYDGLQKSIGGKIATSSWAFDIISNQDTLSKSSFAYGQMKAKMVQGLYVDDIFDLANNPKDLAKAKNTLSRMMMNGSDEVSIDMLKKDFGDEKAVQIVRRMEDWRQSATKESFDEAIDSVFQKELTGGMKHTRDFLQEKIPGGKIFTPFFTTPMRILDESLQRMPIIPLGDGLMGMPIHPKIYKDLYNPKTRNDALSKIIMGNMVAYAGNVLTEQGMYQPTPTDVDTRAALSSTFGMNPGSLLLNGKSYQTSFLGPVHNLLAIGAATSNQDDIYKRIDHLDDDASQGFYDAIGYNMMNLSALVLEQPFLTGPEQVMELFGALELDLDDQAQKDSWSERISRIMGQKVGNFVPASSLQRQTTNNMMDFQRKASGFWENSFMQFAPYLVENKAYDGYGNPIEPNRGIAFRKRNIQETDLAETLYAENSFLPTRPKFKYLYSKSDGGMNKTPSATIDLGKLGLWNKWNEMRADGMGLAIRDFINSQEYSDNMKANRVDENRTAIQSIINTKNKRAFEDLMREHPIIEREVMRSQGEKIIEKQKGKGYVSGVSNVPTFMGE